MPDAETPQFHVSNEGEPFPPVDPEDLKRVWKIQPGDKEAWNAERARGLDSALAIQRRCWMIKVTAGFNHRQLLAPWQHGGELDDAVFRLAATFPIRPLRQHLYKVPGDSVWGFDPNAFVQKLVEETGISHTWEPVLARLPEGSSVCTYEKVRIFRGPRDPEAVKEARKEAQKAGPSEREVKLDARQLLWAVWSKCQPNLSRTSGNHQIHVEIVAWNFADFVIDNIDLAIEFVSRKSAGRQLVILSELERRAIGHFHQRSDVARP